MTDENEAMEAIKKAIQMEKDGRDFYLNAAAQTSSSMGRSIFESLANDELIHLQTFKKIFEDQVSAEEWDTLVESSKKYADLPIFPKNLQQMAGARPDSDELDALNLAMDAEKYAIDFYGRILDSTEDATVRKILEEIISQEKNHYLILNEEFTHLSSTGHWYELGPLGH